MADWDVIDEQPARKAAVAGGWDVVEEAPAQPAVLGVPADIAADPLLQFDGFQMTPDGFVPAPAPEHFNQPRVPVDRSELGDLIGIPMQDSEAGDLSDLFLRGLADLPQLAVDAAKLPLTGADALVRSFGGDPEQSMAMAGIRRLYDTLGEAADYLPNEMDAIGMGRGSVDGGQLVEALNPSTEMPLGDRLGDVGTFALEQSVRSTPQMAAALASVPAYVAGRAEQVAERRVENDGRELVTLPDLGIAVPAAAVEALLERFTTARLLPGGTTINSTGVMDALGGILREIGLQGGLGGIEELAPYLAETAGTEQGSTLADAVETFAAGAVTEGAMGAAGQVAKEVAARLPTGRSAAPSADAGAPSPSAPPSRPLGEAAVDELDALLVQNIPELAEAANLPPAPAAATPTPSGQVPERASLPAQDFVAQLAARMRQSSQEQAARTAGQPAQSPAAPVGSRPAGGDLIREPDGIAPERPQRYSAPDLRQEIGWSQRGGELVRAAPDTSTLNDEERLGLVNMPRGEVTGRTRWTGWPDPTGEESVFWRNRPDKGLSEKQANAALDKFERGEPLKAIEQRFVDHAETTAREYSEAMDLQDDAMRGYEAQDRQRAIEEIRAEIEVAEPDADAALSLYEIARQAAERGIPDTEITPARGESEPAYAARLWRRIQEAPRGTDTPAAAEDRGQGSAGRESGPERAALTLAAEAVPEPEPARQEVAPGLFGAPSARDFVDAARRDRDSKRDGRTGTETPSFTGTPLGAGPAPEQGRVPERRDEPVESVEPFFSAATRAITEGKGAPKRADAGAWKGWLDGAVRRGDMKQSERDWLGVDDFIASKGNVTRDEIAEFVRANQVQVEDVVLGERAPPTPDELVAQAMDAYDAEYPDATPEDREDAESAARQWSVGDLYRRDATRIMGLRRDQLGQIRQRGDTNAKFAKWQLPGGENYRELLLTIPEQKPARDAKADRINAQIMAMVDEHGDTSAMPADVRAEYDRLEAEYYRLVDAPVEPVYTSSHFDQPNILAHVRFNERTDADGKRVLFIEEIQSDWHQAGRKRGYAGPDREKAKRDANAAFERAENAYNERVAELQASGEFARMPLSQVRALPEAEAVAEARERVQSFYGDQGVPDAPFKGTDEWAMLAFKRMVRHAAENGFDRIAWTTGEQQAERYDLSKQVDRVAITPTGGVWAVTAWKDGASVIQKDARNEAELAELVGKDLADRAVKDRGGEYSGLDLKVGGSGMRAFYDSILPKAVNKWAKRFGGRVGRAQVASERTQTRTAEEAQRDGGRFGKWAEPSMEPVHALDLTPAMREAALEGLPLFSTEATESDLSPDETASLSRQRERGQIDAVQRETRAALSRQRGESDAASRGLKEAVDKVLPGNSVQFIRGMDGLPEHVRTMLESRNRGRKVRTAGLYDPETGTAYILTDVVTDPKRAAWHAAHELAGHHGLRGVIAEKAKVGNRTAREALDVALDIALQNPTVKRLADAIADERKSRDRLLMAEEALAELAAATRTGDYDAIQSRYGVEVPAAQRKTLAGAVARFIDRILAIFRAIAPGTFSDSDVAELVEGAWRYARGEGGTTGEAAEQVVFHGTPHAVDRFSLHKIGTGEGAQAYGWGLYFAGRREVAEHYRDNVKDSAKVQEINRRLSELARIMEADEIRGSHRKYRTDAGRNAAEEYDALLADRSRPGNLYQVDVPEDSDLLDFDKPMAQQPEKVRTAALEVWNALPEWFHEEVVERTNAEFDDLTGNEFYQVLGKFNSEGGMPGRFDHPEATNRHVGDREAASHALFVAGIPGLRYLDGASRRQGEGAYNYVIWDESTISDPQVLESVEYTPAQEAALAKAGLPVDRRSSLQRITDKVRGEIDKVREAARDSDALKQATFDRFHGLRMAEADLALSPEQSPYIAARMTAGLSSNMEGLMLFGAPAWDGGILTIKDGTVGLLDALKPVEGKLDQWLGWMVGRRAQVLKRQGRENNLSDADIAALLTLADGNEAAFQKAAGDYLKIKNAVLDVAEQAGLIDPAARAAWDHAEYIPFYRAENSGFVGPGTRKGLAGQTSGIRTLKGGQEVLADPLANIVRNFSKLIDASLKNRATLLAVDEFGPKLFQPAAREMQPAAIPLDQVKKHLQEQGVPESTIAAMPTHALKGVQRMLSVVPPTGEDVVRVMRQGKPEYYTVLDPLVLRSLTAFKQPHKNIAIKPFIWFKRLLTVGVTTTAEFVGANFIRDTASAWVISDDRFIPGWDSLKGVGNTIRGDQGTRDMMMAGSTFLGGNFYDGNPDEAAAALRRALRRKGMKDHDIEGFIGTIARSPLQLWDAWLRLSGAVENANRRAVYDAAIKAGRSRTEAAFAARDLMDFAMQGDSAFVQFFADVVPFFNARLQGLYKLGRRAGTREGKRAIILRGGIITMASVALYAWNMIAHQDAYDELEEWDKDVYWHIAPGTEFHTRIPKPFEIGLVFGMVPERSLEAIRHATTGEGDSPSVTWDALLRGLTDTLRFTPVPQAALPIMEEWANKRSFTGRPIENMGDENLLPEARADWYTSDTMKALGRMSGMSPKRLEHLWLGYTAGLGGYVLDASDVLVRKLQDAPDRPEMTKAEWPALGRFLRGGSPGRSKYTTLFYERLREVKQTEQTVKELWVKGDQEAANALEAENKAILGERVPSKQAKGGFVYSEARRLRKVQSKVSDLREEIEGIVLDRNLTQAQKRARIDTLEARRNRMVKEALEQ